MTSGSEKVTDRNEIKQYFQKKRSHLEKMQGVYDKALFGSLLVHNPETWKMVAMQNPNATLAYFTYGNFIETFDVLESIAEGIIDLEDKIAKVETDLQKIAKDNDISTVKTNVAELQNTMLPIAKGMVKLIDKLNKDEEQWKKNGEKMLV